VKRLCAECGRVFRGGARDVLCGPRCAWARNAKKEAKQQAEAKQVDRFRQQLGMATEARDIVTTKWVS
jgi:predicted  nucleic acid-binding Zn-ribbon protein